MEMSKPTICGVVALMAASLATATAAGQASGKGPATKAAADKAAADKVAAEKATADKAAADKTAADKAAVDKAAADKAAADRAATLKAAVDKAAADVAPLIPQVNLLRSEMETNALAGNAPAAWDKRKALDTKLQELKQKAQVLSTALAAAPAPPAAAPLAPPAAAVAGAPAAPLDAATILQSATTSAADATQKSASLSAATSSTCGSGTDVRPQFCFYVGVFVASGSLAEFSVGSLHGGKTGHALVSTAIPAAGVRMPIDRAARFSIELGLMSMLTSKDLTASTARNACRSTNNNFENNLPCAGNVSISPVVGTYFGVTAGTPDVGLVTLMPMVGGATTSLDGSIRPYYGIALGIVNLSKTFNISPNPQ